MSKLFDLLNKYYGTKGAWTEVEEVLSHEGKTLHMNDFYDPFKNLVIGILSQNTSDKNSTRAYLGLVKKFGKITPKVLSKAPLSRIRNSIRSGGLYNLKARRIKRLAQLVLRKYKGNLTKITKLSEKKAREELLNLPGVGPKTADVFIGYCMKVDTLPIDTNITRVAKRIGIVSKNSRYEEIQKALTKIFPPKQRLRGHELLIRLGRDFCRAKNPLCDNCPIKPICKMHL
jgi:endonuclease-3